MTETAEKSQGVDESLAARLLCADVLVSACPSRILLQHVTSRWGILCLFVLRDGTLRFSEIRDLIGGVSERMLSETLKNLAEDGFVQRISHPVVPPHVDYSLTEAGQEVAAKLADLITWIEDFQTAKVRAG